MSLPHSLWPPRAPDRVWTLTLSYSSGSERVRRRGGILGGFDFTWRRSRKAPSSDKSPSCGECPWVTVGHGSASHPLPPFSVCLLHLFLSSIHLSFHRKRKIPRRTMGFFCPHYHPDSGDAYWTGATPTKGFPFCLFSPPLNGFTSP